jgi:hypothetical protein
MIIFRIVSTLTNQYSDGGSDPTWSNQGKIWRTKGALSLHMTQLSSQGRRIYRNNKAVVVQYEVIESEVAAESIDIWIEAVDKRQQKRDNERDAAQKARQRERDLATYKALKAQFET